MGNDANERRYQPVSRTDSELARVETWARIFNEVYTQRLLLRRLSIGDGPAMFAIHGDPATNLYNPHGPHPDLATSEEMLRSCLDHWENFGFGIWAVTLPQHEHIIGFGGIEHLHWQQRDVLNLYYRFTPGAWGNGYATESGTNGRGPCTGTPPTVARNRPYKGWEHSLHTNCRAGRAVASPRSGYGTHSVRTRLGVHGIMRV